MTDQLPSPAPTPPQTITIPNAPIHPLAALATVALDWIWTFPELVASLSVVGLIPTMLALGGISWLTVTLVQRFIAKDEWGAAVAKGLVMGVISGVPYAVVGTVTGIPLLLWAGAHEAQKLLPPPTPKP